MTLHDAVIVKFRDLLILRTQARLLVYENERLCGIPTILDPRFKNYAFHNDANVTEHILSIQHLLKKKSKPDLDQDPGNTIETLPTAASKKVGLFSFVTRY